MAKATAAWLLLPAIGLSELLAHLYFARRPPNIEEWRAAKPVLSGLRRHDELVVVAPDWAEPNARHAFGDALMPLSQVARADETPYPRAIEVSILGADAPELRGFHVVEERRAGKFRFRVFENPHPARVLFDFADHVASATVNDVSEASVETPCRWNPSARRDAGGLHGNPAYPSMRHECPGGDWHFVGVTVVEDERWKGRRCIWAAPPGSGTLSIRYRDVPIGSVIRGYATLPWWIEREKKGVPVRMQVVVGGDVLSTYVHDDGDGWKGFEMAAGVHAGTRADVEFRISSDHGRDRQFCFQADSR
jgi:hypothetical protein